MVLGEEKSAARLAALIGLIGPARRSLCHPSDVLQFNLARSASNTADSFSAARRFSFYTQ
jgi:hypothetical protein